MSAKFYTLYYPRFQSCQNCQKVQSWRVEYKDQILGLTVLVDYWRLVTEGFLAKSLCDFRSWTTENPVQEILHTRVDKTPSLCYSSSFPLLPQNASTLFSKIIGEAEGCLGDSLMSEVENAVLETKQNFYTGKRRHRLAAVKLSRSPDSAVMIEAEFMEVWVSQPSTVKAPWRATFPVLANKSDFLVVTSTTREQDFDKLEYKLLEPGFPLSAITTQMSTISVAASVHAAVVGEGFHRRYVMDVELLENGICGGAFSDKTVLMRVPVSKTMYLDLDEIRRMERYNDLVLLSFTKHIEIERPSPVSSQYVVGLEFTIPSTNKARIEFPLHFRYQAPTENGMYRQASVIAPDLFLVCPNGDRFVKRKLKISNDDDAAAQNYFQTWGLTAMSHPASGNHRWLRLTTTSSIPVMDVHVPVGYLPSAWFVSSMTLLFASTGAALLLWISFDIAKKPQEPSTIGGASWKGKTD
ncbi:unnamed protein product [Peronospora belbahrii]|uniref:Phosphatidylinositol-glycan biosynthesis class X protein n=1 Tax=Peronospora belbahrii TaxID=622444 RepID=A0AAU9L9R1_9STRA|nr:unnamed protein product [Peronospora belbahrii]